MEGIGLTEELLGGVLDAVENASPLEANIRAKGSVRTGLVTRGLLPFTRGRKGHSRPPKARVGPGQDGRASAAPVEGGRDGRPCPREAGFWVAPAPRSGSAARVRSGFEDGLGWRP